MAARGHQAEGDPMNTAERTFVILKHVNRVPSLASCTRCQRKFFTPRAYQGDPVGAEQYLLGKFEQHKCDGAGPLDVRRGIDAVYRAKPSRQIGIQARVTPVEPKVWNLEQTGVSWSPIHQPTMSLRK
jgi:hypothetical protein